MMSCHTPLLPSPPSPSLPLPLPLSPLSPSPPSPLSPLPSPPLPPPPLPLSLSPSPPLPPRAAVTLCVFTMKEGEAIQTVYPSGRLTTVSQIQETVMKEIGIAKESADCFGIWLSSKHLSKYTEIGLEFKCINFPPSHACELTALCLCSTILCNGNRNCEVFMATELHHTTARMDTLFCGGGGVVNKFHELYLLICASKTLYTCTCTCRRSSFHNHCTLQLIICPHSVQ